MPVHRAVRLVNRNGLHARPISRLVEVARRHQAALKVRFGGREADGRSVLELMTLGATPGAELELMADGADAEALLDELERLVVGRFGEE